MDNFAQHMFSDAAKAAQESAGIRAKYERVYPTRLTDGLQPEGVTFVETRTSCYIASIVDSGYPYIQHRGGPAGFLKVLDADTIAFADYPGNKQFITWGNLQTNDRVSLILMDYPRRARLKLIGRATMVQAADDPDLAAQLATQGQGTPERLVTIRITAQDWNCPKYITPRFTEDEISRMLGPKMQQMGAQIGALSARLEQLGESPAAILATVAGDNT